MDWLINFLKIPSVAAIIGAVAAFFLVILTDWRRNRRKKKTLYYLISINKSHAEKKWETIEGKLKAITEHNKIIPGPILPFGVQDIKRLESEVLDLLSVGQKQALDAICYTMEAIDSLIKAADDRIEKIISLGKGNLEINELVETLPPSYSEILVNLARLVDMANLFVNDKFNDILTKQYKREDYEEWRPTEFR